MRAIHELVRRVVLGIRKGAAPTISVEGVVMFGKAPALTRGSGGRHGEAGYPRP